MASIAEPNKARQLLISLALKRQKAGSGSGTHFLQQRTARMLFPDLSATLQGVAWAVIGAAAVRLYMPERATNDLDILVSADDAPAVRERMKQSGAAYQAELSIGGSTWRLPDGFPVDILEGREGWCKSALTEAQANRGIEGFPILPLPYLVLMKFNASRVQDLADVSRMLGQANEEQLNAVRATFAEWQSDGVEDLESLILLGKLEMQ